MGNRSPSFEPADESPPLVNSHVPASTSSMQGSYDPQTRIFIAVWGTLSAVALWASVALPWLNRRDVTNDDPLTVWGLGTRWGGNIVADSPGIIVLGQMLLGTGLLIAVVASVPNGLTSTLAWSAMLLVGLVGGFMFAHLDGNYYVLDGVRSAIAGYAFALITLAAAIRLEWFHRPRQVDPYTHVETRPGRDPRR